MSRCSEPFDENQWQKHGEFDPLGRRSGFGMPAPEIDPSEVVTRVQISAVISGERPGFVVAPDLAARLKRLCAASGQHLQSLSVQVVRMPVICPRCGEPGLRRIERRGFLQLKVFPLFGFFPWVCVSCREPRLLRLRQPAIWRTAEREQGPATRAA